ncbi:MAG TPA: hypothetical protein VN540_02925 [Clostridia bacterium]|nr:hypothetical protein [Clostridia bacterium]
MLFVEHGERGLRQSEGLFQHVRNLGALIPEVLGNLPEGEIISVGVSARPRPEADSYMPVFLAGRTAAATLAAARGVPLYEFSHQEGHIRAALLGNEALIGGRFLSMHLSGGTTETLLVGEDGSIALIGGTSDLHAGQFVDRVGVAMGLDFPCGKALEKLAAAFDGKPAYKLPSAVQGCGCSFSGVESEAQRRLAAGADKPGLAYAVYDCMARTFSGMLFEASKKTGCDEALLAGGVASSALLRRLILERMGKRGNIKLYFGESSLSSDNAVGAALLARDASAGGERA